MLFYRYNFSDQWREQPCLQDHFTWEVLPCIEVIPLLTWTNSLHTWELCCVLTKQLTFNTIKNGHEKIPDKVKRCNLIFLKPINVVFKICFLMPYTKLTTDFLYLICILQKQILQSENNFLVAINFCGCTLLSMLLTVFNEKQNKTETLILHFQCYDFEWQKG